MGFWELGRLPISRLQSRPLPKRKGRVFRILLASLAVLLSMQRERSHEGGQREGVSSVLDTEDAQQEAVHEEHNSGPSNDGHTLRPDVANARDLDGEGDGAEGQDAVYIGSGQQLALASAMERRLIRLEYSQIAATTCVSSPYWLWKLPAK